MLTRLWNSSWTRPEPSLHKRSSRPKKTTTYCRLTQRRYLSNVSVFLLDPLWFSLSFTQPSAWDTFQLSSCSVPDVSPEESDGEGGGGAETETSEVRAEPSGQSDQRAGPPQENGGKVLLAELPLNVTVNWQLVCWYRFDLHSPMCAYLNTTSGSLFNILSLLVLTSFCQWFPCLSHPCRLLLLLMFFPTFLPHSRSCRKRRTVWQFSWTRAAGAWISWKKRRRV